MYVFFFKQKTAYEMRISDWSSDVCSSDLKLLLKPGNHAVAQLSGTAEIAPALRLLKLQPRRVELFLQLRFRLDLVLFGHPPLGQFGRLLLKDRKSVV